MSKTAGKGKAVPAHLRIEELAEATGATVRNIRVYQEKGLMQPPIRKGRTAIYNRAHLERLRRILALLDRGFTFATIEELFLAETNGLSIAEFIEADNPKALRRAGVRRRRFTRTEAESLAGYKFSDETVSTSIDSGLIEDEAGEEGFISEPVMYELFREMIELGVSQEDIDQIVTTVFAGQETTAKAFGPLTAAIEANPVYAGRTKEQIYAVVNDLLPRCGAVIRVIFQAVAEKDLKDRLLGGGAAPEPEPEPLDDLQD